MHLSLTKVDKSNLLKEGKNDRVVIEGSSADTLKDRNQRLHIACLNMYLDIS